jgi:DNA invertase Pin-like site-specific DNA recombinase
LQRESLNRAVRERFIEDTVSRGKVQRPSLERIHDALRSGGVLAVWRLDRLGRSLKHLIELEAERFGFQSVTESIDTTTPGGKLVFHIFGALAKFERNLILENATSAATAIHRVIDETIINRTRQTSDGSKRSREGPNRAMK